MIALALIDFFTSHPFERTPTMSNGRKTYQKLVETARAAADKSGSPADSYKRLIAAAKAAAKNSYSPYSRYPVGAAVLTVDGKVFTGCNVENVSFGGTICAERTALVKAVSEGSKDFQAIAVFCEKSPGGWPCGICRQFLCEFGMHIDVVVANADGKIEWKKLEDLVPGAFAPGAVPR